MFLLYIWPIVNFPFFFLIIVIVNVRLYLNNRLCLLFIYIIIILLFIFFSEDLKFSGKGSEYGLVLQTFFLECNFQVVDVCFSNDFLLMLLPLKILNKLLPTIWSKR